MNVYPQDKQFSYLHVDFGAGESNFSCQSNLGWDVFAGFNRIVNELFE